MLKNTQSLPSLAHEQDIKVNLGTLPYFCLCILDVSSRVSDPSYCTYALHPLDCKAEVLVITKIGCKCSKYFSISFQWYCPIQPHRLCLRQVSFSMDSGSPGNSWCRSGWPWTCSNPPTSASQVLGFQVWTTKPDPSVPSFFVCIFETRSLRMGLNS